MQKGKKNKAMPIRQVEHQVVSSLSQPMKMCIRDRYMRDDYRKELAQRDIKVEKSDFNIDKMCIRDRFLSSVNTSLLSSISFV